jgi:hypothetical protein
MLIETCETEEISWIDNASRGETPPTIAQRRRERARGGEGFPGPKPAGMGNTHPPICDYVISLALRGSENPAASPSSPLLALSPSSSSSSFFVSNTITTAAAALDNKPRRHDHPLYTQSKITPPMSTQVKYEDDDLELYGGQSIHLGVFYRPLSWSTRLSARPD